MPSAVRFDNVYVSPRVRVALHSVLETQYAKKFWELINKLRTGSFNTPGMRIERLHTKKGKVYSARINVDMRVIFSMYFDKEKGERSLVVWDANHHDDAYDRLERTVIPAVFDSPNEFLQTEQIWCDRDQNLDKVADETPDNDDITDGLLLFKVPYFVLHEPDKFRTFEKNIDRYLRLSEEQEDLLSNTKCAYLVRGSAGTGKTSLALFYALNLNEEYPNDDIYFFTYHDELACVCRSYKANLVEDEEDENEEEKEGRGDFHVFSYLEFCRHYLRRTLDSSKLSWKWIDRAESIKHLKEIVGTRSRWARSIRVDNLYSYIYSILKGRFVPGTDRLPNSADDFRRIFKGYGTVPENLDDILEIFGHYEERLNRLKQKDEADLIRHCYQQLKEKAVLSDEGKATWIVIDEIQDFTELEWKSILLFWENQCLSNQSKASYPFLCGDKNQNISCSGFRWQEVDSYVETILREAHRPNAIQKVQLHKNFRNTRQIFDLAVFVHEQAPNAGADLGTPPELIGYKPQVVVGEESDFLDFLKQLDKPIDDDLPAPLVVLSEDIDALAQMKRSVPNQDALFFMALQKSKGLEFEDLIIYRLFSSLEHYGEDISEEQANRLFDLWYMAITRARQNLLIFMTPDDLTRFKHKLGARFSEFVKRVDVHTVDIETHLSKFHEHRERYLPNYSIVFIERTRAAEYWEEFRQLTGQGKNSAKAEELKDKAIKLWKRCRDVASLGRAYSQLSQYEEAIPYLSQASLFNEVAACYEKLGRFEDAAKSYEEEGIYLDAARCYEKCKQYEQAASLYEQQKEWLQAASNYYLAGSNLKAASCFEQIGMWKSAADLYRSKSNWAKAAELYIKCDEFEAAGDMYTKLKDKLDAARCYVKADQQLRAAALFEQLMRWGEAAECYERAGESNKAGVLYSKAGRLKDAARCKEQSGDLVSAAAAYERMKQWDKAAQAYIGLKQWRKAADCYEHDKNWNKAFELYQQISDMQNAARCLDHLGLTQEAALCYEKANAFNDAGHCYEKVENWADAADQYLKAKNFGSAASMLARLGRRLDAARLYLLAGQASVAIEVASPKAGKSQEADLRPELIQWAEETKKHDVAAAVYDAMGNYSKAADKYLQAMMLSKAAEMAEKQGAFEAAAELFMQDGKFDLAAQCFQRAKQIKRAAQCYEMLKRWTDAKELYESIDDQEGIRRCETAANWL